jgi:hypothetical protein
MPTAMQAPIIEGPGSGVVRHRDPRHVPDTAWANCRNVRFPTGGSTIRKTDGYMRVDGTTPAEPIRALWHYENTLSTGTGGGTQFVRITTTRILTSLGSETRDITYPGTPPRTIDDVITLDQYKDELFWADGITPVMVWAAELAAPAFPGGVPNGKLLEIHKDRLLLGNITQPGVGDNQPQPWKVMYSAKFAPRDFTGTDDNDTAGDIDFLEDNAPIVALKVLGDHCIVHKPSRVYRMIAVGAPEFYQVEQIPADDGAISARAAVSVGSHQYYMGTGNLYRLGAFTEPIGDAVWPQIAEDMDWSKRHLVYAYRRQQHDEVCWKIPRRVPLSDLTVVYNFRDQSWSLTDHDSGTCFAEFPQIWFAHVLGLGIHPPSGDMFGQANGNIQVYGGRNADGAPIQAWAESKHFTAGMNPAKILAVACYATGTGILWVRARAAMEGRQFPLEMPEWGPAQAYVLPPSQTRPWIDVRHYGRLWQVRIESNALEDDWEVSAYGPAVIPGGYAR